MIALSFGAALLLQVPTQPPARPPSSATAPPTARPRAARLAQDSSLRGYDACVRSRMSDVGRPLSGVGVGASLLDGMLRLDVARGLYPRKQWRVDLSLGARF
jgi:hypothetical protein